MRVDDRLNSEQKRKLKSISKQNKPPSKKQERVNWPEIMGMNRDTYKRHNGAIRRK